MMTLMDDQPTGPEDSSLESIDTVPVQATTPPLPDIPVDRQATNFKRPLFGLGKPVLVVAIVVLLLLVGGLVGAFINHKTTKTTKTVVVNTQTLDNGTLNKLTGQLGGKGQVTQQLTISPSTLFKNNVAVQGTLQVQKNLGVDGNLSVGGGLTVKNGASVGGNLTVSGQVTAASLSVGSITLSTITLSGNLSVGGHIVTTGVTPAITASVGAAAGTATIAGNDITGTVTITTGKGAPIAGEMAIITFHTPFSLAPGVQLTPLNADAATVQSYVTEHATFFTIRSAATPAASTIYSFNYFVTQ